ncbi:MAG: hypothetical protein ABUL72_00625 [Armatimonadota bacterium]
MVASLLAGLALGLLDVRLKPLVAEGPQIVIGPTNRWAPDEPRIGVFPGYEITRPLSVVLPGRTDPVLRAQVCAQSSSLTTDIDWASRAIGRSWELMNVHLGLDLPTTVEERTVHVLLRTDGNAGGEQQLTRPPGVASDMPWCVIYIYQVPTLTAPAERWREVAHEYGHAVFPAWGPYEGPESWSNGEIGERLATAWMYDALLDGSAAPEDAAGASAQSLLGYMQTNVWAEAVRVGQRGPQPELLEGKSGASFWAGVRLVTFAQQVLPEKVLRRSLGLSGGANPKDFADAMVEAVAEQPTIRLRIPRGNIGKPVWLPTGSLKVSARVLAKKDGWSQISTSNSTVVLTR